MHRVSARSAGVVLTVMAVLCASPAAAAPPQPSAPRAIHAVSAAGLASAMTYCIARHGPLRQGSPAAVCYAEARAILATADLRQRAAEVDARCPDPATFNECLTPEIGRLVYTLNERFSQADL